MIWLWLLLRWYSVYCDCIYLICTFLFFLTLVFCCSYLLLLLNIDILLLRFIDAVIVMLLLIFICLFPCWFVLVVVVHDCYCCCLVVVVLIVRIRYTFTCTNWFMFPHECDYSDCCVGRVVVLLHLRCYTFFVARWVFEFIYPFTLFVDVTICYVVDFDCWILTPLYDYTTVVCCWRCTHCLLFLHLMPRYVTIVPGTLFMLLLRRCWLPLFVVARRCLICYPLLFWCPIDLMFDFDVTVALYDYPFVVDATTLFVCVYDDLFVAIYDFVVVTVSVIPLQLLFVLMLLRRLRCLLCYARYLILPVVLFWVFRWYVATLICCYVPTTLPTFPGYLWCWLHLLMPICSDYHTVVVVVVIRAGKFTLCC